MSTIVAFKSAESIYLQVALPGQRPENAGVLLLDPETDRLYIKLRQDWQFAGEEAEVLSQLEDDLQRKAAEMGGLKLLEYLENNVSNLVRITERESMQVGDFEARLRRLFRENVGTRVAPFATHLPLTGIRAAAGALSAETIDEGAGDWVEAPSNLRLSKDMFVIRVEGRSMEPLIPDGSLCVFRQGVAGSRQGRKLLIQRFGASGSAQFTIKVYRSEKRAGQDGDWEHDRIRLEPLNPEFEPWYLTPDEFAVLGEFVALLPPEE